MFKKEPKASLATIWQARKAGIAVATGKTSAILKQ